MTGFNSLRNKFRIIKSLICRRLQKIQNNNSTQIGVLATGTFHKAAWNGQSLPCIKGDSRIYQSFKPSQACLSEVVTVTYSKTVSEQPSVQSRRKSKPKTKTLTEKRVIIVENASDLLLTSAFVGNINCFPNAPNLDAAISGQAFACNAIGRPINWPILHDSSNLNVLFAVQESALYKIQPPTGFTYDDIVSVKIDARFSLFGPLVSE